MTRLILIVAAILASACTAKPRVKNVAGAGKECQAACEVELRTCQVEMSPVEEEFFCQTALDGCTAKCPVTR